MMEFTNAPPSASARGDASSSLRSSGSVTSDSLKSSGNLRSSREGEMTSAMQARVSDEWLELIAEVHPEVLYLDLTKAYRLTDGGISTFLPSSCDLREICQKYLSHFYYSVSRNVAVKIIDVDKMQAPHRQVFPQHFAQCVHTCHSGPTKQPNCSSSYRFNKFE
jgi:hypothetical protein